MWVRGSKRGTAIRKEGDLPAGTDCACLCVRDGRSCLAGSIQINAIKWFIAKSAARRYGEKAVPDATVNASIGDVIVEGRDKVGRLREG